MKKLFILTLLAAGAISMGLFTGHASQQQRAARVGNDNFTDLKLSLATLKGGFLPLEPIPVIVTISNPTTHPVRGHTAIDFSANYIELYVSQGDGEPRKIRDLSPTLSQGFVRSRDIEPGDEVTSPQILTVNLDQVFPEPGKYYIEALFYDAPRRQSIRSNKLQIQIQQPEGENARALDFILRNKNKQWFFSGNGFADGAFVQELEQFAEEFSNTAYADYATDLLGDHYYAIGDESRALIYYLKLEKKDKFIYKDEVSDHLRQIKRKLAPPPSN